jgi:hypothetical protein
MTTNRYSVCWGICVVRGLNGGDEDEGIGLMGFTYIKETEC